MKKYLKHVLSVLISVLFLGLFVACIVPIGEPRECEFFSESKSLDHSFIIKVLDQETNLPISDVVIEFAASGTFLDERPAGADPPCEVKLLEFFGAAKMVKTNANGVAEYSYTRPYTSKDEYIEFRIGIRKSGYSEYYTTYTVKAPEGNPFVKFIPLTVYLVQNKLYP
jgi:hypothetical protein